jgi:hypothetical protein
VLFIAGMSFVAMGISFFFYIPGGPRIQALQIAVAWLPIEAWGVVFIGVGVAVVISSRWPAHAAAWGYAVLTGLSSGWSATYFLGWAVGDSAPGNLTYVVYWALLAFLWWAIGGLVNPSLKEEADGTNEESQV